MNKLFLIIPLIFLSSNAFSASSCVDKSNGGPKICFDNVSITTGGAAENLFGGAVPKTGYDVRNPDATEDCWVSDSETAAPNAAGSFRLQANGGWYESPIGKPPPNPVSVYCATTGHKLTASRW